MKRRVGATNLERVYSRNKIRLDILPYMKENFNSDIIQSINRMGKILKEDYEFINEEVNTYYKQYVSKDKGCLIISKGTFELKKSILSRIIRIVLANISGSKYDLELKHIDEIIALARLDSGKRIDLPKGILAINVYKDIVIDRKSTRLNSSH